MEPVGPLMHEHRDIERVIVLLQQENGYIASGKEPDTRRIDELCSIMREFADRCHHGKEEDILFRELQKKDLSEEHRRILDELTSEHVLAREMVQALLAAKEEFQRGNHRAIVAIQAQLEKIAGLYPEHIAKEDKKFFHPCLDYFSQQERQAMLEEFEAFEKRMDHEDWLARIKALEIEASARSEM